MKEKERYIYTKIDGYYWIKDIETNENYCVDKKIVKLFNQQDKEIAKLQYRLEVAEKAFELACDPRDDWGGKEYSGTEFNNYHDYFIAEAEQELAKIKGGKDE